MLLIQDTIHPIKDVSHCLEGLGLNEERNQIRGKHLEVMGL